MSKRLERNFIGEEEDVQQEDVECNLQLNKKLLQEVQEDLEDGLPKWNPITCSSSRDMEMVKIHTSG